jgi:hypothetical protein
MIRNSQDNFPQIKVSDMLMMTELYGGPSDLVGDKKTLDKVWHKVLQAQGKNCLTPVQQVTAQEQGIGTICISTSGSCSKR